jgi:hypothetical protein
MQVKRVAAEAARRTDDLQRNDVVYSNHTLPSLNHARWFFDQHGLPLGCTIEIG